MVPTGETIAWSSAFEDWIVGVIILVTGNWFYWLFLVFTQHPPKNETMVTGFWMGFCA